MRHALFLAAVMAIAGTAEAQISRSLAVGDSMVAQSIAPGATHNGTTCTYGGFYEDVTPLLGTTQHLDVCFPGNTGPTGATGATGAAGAQGPGIRYVDMNNTPVTDVYWYQNQAHWWSGNAFWPVDPLTGQDRLTYTNNQPIAYATSSCNTGLLAP